MNKQNKNLNAQSVTIGAQIKCVTIQMAGQGIKKQEGSMSLHSGREGNHSYDEQMKPRNPK